MSKLARIAPAALAIWLAALSPALAQSRADHPVVVELYTSQGCSSCPPADRILAGLAGRDDVIALALHVDYWDYIGWADAFGDARFSERQRAYARAFGARTVYTPQMIVGGSDHVMGVRPAELESLIRQHGSDAAPVLLHLSRAGNVVAISARASRPLDEGAIVQLVRYSPHARVEISRGENAGRTIDYSNIVTGWDAIGEWDGQGPLDMKVKAPGAEPVVVILQAPGPGEILAAARLK
ncbi:MAG: DUF1223 domain-containing protein [Defluviimonas sp.]|uniref:DUF1223 domain-containing protein n=1 Tax=Albidovulum sp. TaxID=1872424 RepID=UPI001E15DEE2|nr:DUF1223 domain-containing protein [Paracoccaceae bacterium]MCC0064111.1 DUF1223 domain-containing protein [Defluviimonas sp.]